MKPAQHSNLVFFCFLLSSLFLLSVTPLCFCGSAKGRSPVPSYAVEEEEVEYSDKIRPLLSRRDPGYSSSDYEYSAYQHSNGRRYDDGMTKGTGGDSYAIRKKKKVPQLFQLVNKKLQPKKLGFFGRFFRAIYGRFRRSMRFVGDVVPTVATIFGMFALIDYAVHRKGLSVYDSVMRASKRITSQLLADGLDGLRELGEMLFIKAYKDPKLGKTQYASLTSKLDKVFTGTVTALPVLYAIHKIIDWKHKFDIKQTQKQYDKEISAIREKQSAARLQKMRRDRQKRREAGEEVLDTEEDDEEDEAEYNRLMDILRERTDGYKKKQLEGLYLKQIEELEKQY